MALKIRLARGGTKKRPFYRIVVADSRAPRDGRFIDRVGTYDPRLPKDSEQRVQIDAEKAAEWLKKGALPTDRVARFLAAIQGVDGKPLVKWEHGSNPKRGEPGVKAKERAEERAEKLAARQAAEEEARNAAKEKPAAEPAEATEGEG